MPSLSSTSRFLNGKRLTMSFLNLRSIRCLCISPALANTAEEDAKNVPQRLKPSVAAPIAARVEPCPFGTNISFRKFFLLALGGTILSLPLHGQNQSEILKDYDQAIDQIAEHAMQSVVEIEVTGYGVPEGDKDQGSSQQALVRQRSIGSGVIVDPDGYIITNNHVVAGALRIRVIIAPATVEMVSGNTRLHNPQRVYEAKLIGTTHYADVALIKIDAKGLPFIPLPEQFDFRLGQTVVAIGAPEGLDHTVTKGIISAVGRQPEVDRPMVYVQTDAPINPGNSGG